MPLSSVSVPSLDLGVYVPVIVDFGIAVLDDGHTLSKRTLAAGTRMYPSPAFSLFLSLFSHQFISDVHCFRYASPEQTQSGVAVDGRSDIWSIGVMMYQVLRPSIARRKVVIVKSACFFLQCVCMLPDLPFDSFQLLLKKNDVPDIRLHTKSELTSTFCEVIRFFFFTFF